MKKIILIVMAVFAFISSYSQTEQGKMFIGGQFGLSGYTQSYYDPTSLANTTKYFNIQVTPNIGYFIKDNLAIGGNLNFQTNKTSYNELNVSPETNSMSRTINTYYGAGVFACYYIKIAGDFSFFINGGLSYTYSIGKSEYTIEPIQESDYGSFSFSIKPGVVYFVSPKFGMQATFGSLNTINGFSLGSSTFTFGLNYYF